MLHILPRIAPSSPTSSTELFAVAVSAGASVVLNAGGWILFAAHLIQIVRAYKESARRHAGYRDNIIEFRRDIAANKPERKNWVRRFEKPAAASVPNHVAHERMIPLSEFATDTVEHAELCTRSLPIR